MNAQHNDIGMIGLGTMGSNLVLNIADKGFAVAVFNRTTSVTESSSRNSYPPSTCSPASPWKSCWAPSSHRAGS